METPGKTTTSVTPAGNAAYEWRNASQLRTLHHIIIFFVCLATIAHYFSLFFLAFDTTHWSTYLRMIILLMPFYIAFMMYADGYNNYSGLGLFYIIMAFIYWLILIGILIYLILDLFWSCIYGTSPVCTTPSGTIKWQYWVYFWSWVGLTLFFIVEILIFSAIRRTAKRFRNWSSTQTYPMAVMPSAIGEEAVMENTSGKNLARDRNRHPNILPPNSLERKLRDGKYLKQRIPKETTSFINMMGELFS